ncbi:MAG: hypothetical protein LBQ88_23120 [Treponema sp.]|jgi:hypothetical protein|nr:hypothetical protein [Treponema sp.]
MSISDWVDFYNNLDDALEGKETVRINIAEVHRILAVLEAVRKSAETGQAVIPENNNTKG